MKVIIMMTMMMMMMMISKQLSCQSEKWTLYGVMCVLGDGQFIGRLEDVRFYTETLTNRFKVILFHTANTSFSFFAV